MQASERNREFDVIVVGAGPGGSILAARLAEFGVNPRTGEKLRIALFEWGPYHKGDPIRGYGNAARRGAFDGMPYELARRYMLPWGTLGMVGGSTHWAGMIAHPPVQIDFEHWRAETGVNWTWEGFKEPLEEVYAMWHPYPEPEGVRSPGQEMFRKAAESLGYRVAEASQAKLNCPRCGDCNGRVCKYDAKSTPIVNYIPIAERYGVEIFAQTPVDKVLIEKKGSRPAATGVVYQRDGRLHQASAGAVIVSCGYNGTPRLLFRSGYGPRHKVKGELFAENRNVGSNLVCSVNARGIQMLFDRPIVHPDIGVHTVYHVEKHDATGRNFLIVAESMGIREGTRAFPEDRALSPFAPDFGFELKAFMRHCTTHMGHIRIELSKTALRGDIDADGRVTFGGNTVEDEDRGGVHLDLVEKQHPAIVSTLREGQEIARKIVGVLKPLKFSGFAGLPEILSTNHNHGTCRAGASAENSVVNSDLESHDIDRLFIADASTIPFQCTANPGIPAAAVCSYGWRRIVAKHFTRA